MSCESEYLAECDTCDFKYIGDSAGSAENAAEEHVNNWENGYPNLGHKVRITFSTLVSYSR